jgi:serine/threonine protein kinase
MSECANEKQAEYILQKRLGSGQFGITHLALKKGDNQSYVLKTVTLRNPSNHGVKLEDIHSEIAILKRIAQNGCPKDLLCYTEHFMDCSDPSRIQMNIVTKAFDNAITLQKFIDKYILDISKALDEQLDELEDEKEILEEEIESTNDQDMLESLKKELQKIKKRIRTTQDKIEDDTKYTPLSHKALFKIMHNILTAMHHLHQLNIGHGDIKPENILINEDTYEIQIIDFGLSCTKDCQTAGTIIYDSPEILENVFMPKESTFPVKRIMSADIFSIGVVFYRLANSTFPFPDRVKQELRNRNERGAMKELINFYARAHIFSMYNENRSMVDEHINELIESCFKKEDLRPTIQQLLTRLEEIMHEYNQLVMQRKQKQWDVDSSLSTSPVDFSPQLLSPL